jgi:hypothetical protein
MCAPPVRALYRSRRKDGASVSMAVGVERADPRMVGRDSAGDAGWLLDRRAHRGELGRGEVGRSEVGRSEVDSSELG